MRTLILSAAVAALAAGCGGPVAPANKLADFTGEAWGGGATAAITIGGTCSNLNGLRFHGSAGLDTSASNKVTFYSLGPNELESISAQGCDFKFDVSLDTATLSNGPVTCFSTTSWGETEETAFDSFTATTTDGHYLWLEVAGTYKTASGSVDCDFTGRGAGSR